MKKRITIKNELPELLEAVCNHPDCADWLKDGIWDLFNNQNVFVTFSADYWRSMFDAIKPDRDDEATPVELPENVIPMRMEVVQ